MTFEPGENPAGQYYIVTKAFVAYFRFLGYERRRLTIELDKCRAGKK